MFFSSGSSKKPGAGSSQAKQEMVQVDRSDSASPFWRAPQRNETPPPAAPGSTASHHSRDSSLVVGAAYSHADGLRVDSLSISGSGPRPRSPPSARTTSSSAARSTNDAPPVAKSGSRSGLASPPFKSYMTFLSRTNEDWNVDDTADAMYADYDEDDDGDDGDDFGLPSLSNMKRKTRRLAEAAAAAQQAQNPKPQPGILGASKSLDDTGGGGDSEGQSKGGSGPGSPMMPRRHSNSADIAIERPVPGYPLPKKSEGKILRPQYKDILRDPANALHLIHHAAPPADANQKEMDAMNSRITRINKFKKILQASAIPLTDLRALAWGGVPEEVRAMTWQLLLGYLPTSSERRVATLERKRKEYLDGVRQAFDRGGGAAGSGVGGDNIGPTSRLSAEGRTGGRGGGGGGGAGHGRGLDETIWHQISIDVPRTNPHIELYSYAATQRSLERILYVWAVRHPASGYVQGINDLVTPFWQVFLGTYITDPNIESGMDPGQLPRPVLDAVEADSFWCLSKLLDGIQDHYIVAQPGIQRQVAALRDLTARIDAGLAQHLEREHVEFIQFSFRWMNCLLMREISVNNTIRMWDTYMAEEQGFSEFHLYVCAAFLVKWSAKLVKMDFQEVMMFLQSLPTRDWTEKDIELLLSEAYIWQSLFKGSSAHLRGPSGNRTASPAAPLQL